jgi:hypothetical protein
MFFMANYKSKTCFVMGGRALGMIVTTLSSVSRFNIGKNKWEPGTPSLNIARSSAAACSLGNNIFIFGGTNANYKYLDSIEWIIVPDISNFGAAWELIHLP